MTLSGLLFFVSVLCLCLALSSTCQELSTPPPTWVQPGEYRWINGSNNNLLRPGEGAVGDVMLPYGFFPNADPDFHLLQPNPRVAANALFDRPSRGSKRRISVMFVSFASSVQSYIGTAASSTTRRTFPAPKCDRMYDTTCAGNGTIAFRLFNMRKINRTINGVTKEVQTRYNNRNAKIDMQGIYNYYFVRADWRTYQDGLLYPPDVVYANHTETLINLPYTDLFLREHNNLARRFKAENSSRSDEELFQLARKWNIGYNQKIFTKDYAAALLGIPLRPYEGYRPEMEGSQDLWGALCFRYAHHELPPYMTWLDENLRIDKLIAHQDKKTNINMSYTDMVKLIRGSVMSEAMEIGSGSYLTYRDLFGSDMLTLEIIRSREWGFPKYNDMRQVYNLSAVDSFDQISSDPYIQDTLKTLYGNVSNVDTIVGAVLEDHVKGASVGPLMQATLYQLFDRMRYTDRFWYENTGMFTKDELTEIYGTTTLTLVTRSFPELKSLEEAGFLNLFFLPERQINSSVALFPLLMDPVDWRTVDLSSVYRLSWSTTISGDDWIEFVVQVKTIGWVGIGFKADDNTMKNADIIIMREHLPENVNSSSTPFEIMDCYALDVGPPALDRDLGGTDDVVPVSYDYQNGVKVFRFRRRWSTTDRWDKPLDKRTRNKVIFSFNTETRELLYHGPSRASTARIDFNQGEVSLEKIPHGLTVATIVLSAFSIFLAIVVILFIFKFKWFFVHLGHHFCQLVCFGFILGYIAIILISLPEPTDSICLGFIWLLSYSFVFVFGSIFLKALRLWKIFRSVEKIKSGMQPKKPTYKFQFILLGLLMFFEFAFLLSWTLADPLKAKYVLVEKDTTRNIRCKSNSEGWWITFVVYKLVIMACGSFFVIELRDKKDSLSESKRMIFSLMMTFFASLISTIIGFFLSDRSVVIEVSLIVFAVLFIFNMNMILLFLPLIYGITIGTLAKNMTSDPMGIFNKSKFSKSSAGSSSYER